MGTNRPPSAATEQRFWWITPVLLAISAAAAIVYAGLTRSMLQELKSANELQYEFQSQVLQPVLTIEIGRDILSAGKHDEHWRVTGTIRNAGQVPARAVQGELYWDSSRAVSSFEGRFNLAEVVLAPGGGQIGVSFLISKAEAVAILGVSTQLCKQPLRT